MNEDFVHGILSPFELPSDEEQSLRPKKLSEFIGQASIKENLAIFIQAAREREEPLDHVFLIGPPGLGKTTLAGIISHEMGSELKVTSAPALEKQKDLAGIITTLAPGSVFFIDEIHRLKPAIEEMLYMAMEDGELDFVIGQGPSARTIRIPLPPFTLIGATTKAGMVGSPLVSRFGITLRLGFYDTDAILAILKRSAAILGIGLDSDGAELLARSCRGTPRVANRLLRRLRDFAQVQRKTMLDLASVRFGLERLQVDEAGLEEHDRFLLKTIIEKYNGGPVGLETLAAATGESAETIEDFVEPYLVQAGFIERTPRGRMVTAFAYKHLNVTDRMNDGTQRLQF